jgi:hypothetical protein
MVLTGCGRFFEFIIRGAAMNNGGLMSRIIATFTIAVLTSLFFAAVGLSADNPGASIDEQRQAIENYYKGLIDEIQRHTESSVMEINDTGDAERQKAEAVKRISIAEDLHQERSGSLLSTDELSEYEKERAQSEKDIRNRAENEIKYLQERKARELENVAGGTTSGEVRRVPSGPASALGTVTGIVYYNNSGAALIGGEVVRENDVVMDVKIIKVLPDYVEFEKQGKKWKQAVGQTPPASVWEKKQKPKPATKSSTGPNSNPSPSSSSKPSSTAAPKPNPIPKSNTSSKLGPGSKSNTGNKAKSSSKDIQ